MPNQKPINALLAIFILSLCLSGCADKEAELSTFKSAIRAKYDMKEAAFAANDPEPILTKFYSEEVISIGPDGFTHSGREGIRPIYEEVIGGSVRIESYATKVNGDLGWDWVNFHVDPNAEGSDAEEQQPFTFKLLFLWEKIDGEWWSHGEMYVVGEFEIK